MMPRLNICISKSQNEKLRNICKETGLGVAEAMRRALDMFILKNQKDKIYINENK